jgi:hypothetical protein
VADLVVFGQASANSASFVLPMDTELYPQWQLSVAGSNWLPLNCPETWWWQGDKGQDSTEGGFLRVFGRSMSSPYSVPADPRYSFDDVQTAIENGDEEAASTISRWLARAQNLQQDHTSLPTLRLRPTGSESWPFSVTAENKGASLYNLQFSMDTIPAGDYEAQINGGANCGWDFLEAFSSPQVPHDRTITVQPRTLAASSTAKVFNVGQFCSVGVDCGIVGTNSSFAILAALSAAASNGGGEVLIPRGQWFLNNTGGLVIPANTTLSGVGASFTSIYFPEEQKGEAPYPAYLTSPAAASAASADGLDDAGSATDKHHWGLKDLTIYISHFYEGVVSGLRV